MSPSPWTRSGSRARRSRGGTHKTRGGRTNKTPEPTGDANPPPPVYQTAGAGGAHRRGLPRAPGQGQEAEPIEEALEGIQRQRLVGASTTSLGQLLDIKVGGLGSPW